jgi:hypothetical protein
MSVGGAIAVYFGFTPSSAYDLVDTPLQIENCTFIANVAYSQLCRYVLQQSIPLFCGLIILCGYHADRQL